MASTTRAVKGDPSWVCFCPDHDGGEGRDVDWYIICYRDLHGNVPLSARKETPENSLYELHICSKNGSV
jgi:hypothetical protein